MSETPLPQPRPENLGYEDFWRTLSTTRMNISEKFSKLWDKTQEEVDKKYNLGEDCAACCSETLIIEIHRHTKGVYSGDRKDISADIKWRETIGDLYVKLKSANGSEKTLYTAATIERGGPGSNKGSKIRSQAKMIPAGTYKLGSRAGSNHWTYDYNREKPSSKAKRPGLNVWKPDLNYATASRSGIDLHTLMSWDWLDGCIGVTTKGGLTIVDEPHKSGYQTDYDTSCDAMIEIINHVKAFREKNKKATEPVWRKDKMIVHKTKNKTTGQMEPANSGGIGILPCTKLIIKEPADADWKIQNFTNWGSSLAPP